jgi:hypothetical protein
MKYKAYIGPPNPLLDVKDGVYRVHKAGRGYNVRTDEGHVYYFPESYWRDLTEAENVQILLEEYEIQDRR